jgi:hypothetical protein
MKIGEITEKQSIQRSQDVSQEKRSAKSEDFKTLFENELNLPAGPAQIVPKEMESSVAMAGGVDLSSIWNASVLRNDTPEAFSAARDVGERLEQMSRLIDDGSGSLKRIDEMINALSKESETLREGVKNLPEDHPLRKAGDELSVLAYVESVKWQRGDYL